MDNSEQITTLQNMITELERENDRLRKENLELYRNGVPDKEQFEEYEARIELLEQTIRETRALEMQRCMVEEYGAEHVRRAYNLNEKEALCLVLKQKKGLVVDEIAEWLDIPIATVSRHISNATTKIIISAMSKEKKNV
jgi:DNA-directed RNA polymerase specialized sigma24 family protein